MIVEKRRRFWLNNVDEDDDVVINSVQLMRAAAILSLLNEPRTFAITPMMMYPPPWDSSIRLTDC